MLKELIYFTHFDMPQIQNYTDIVVSAFNKHKLENSLSLYVHEIEDEETQELMNKYNIQAVPSLVFLDEKGDYIRKITGSVPSKDLECFMEYDLNKKLFKDDDGKTIISFSGRAHNGKTMLSDYLVENEGFVRMSVAHALKRICANLLGFPSIDEMNKHKTEEKKYVLKDADIKFLADESEIPCQFIKDELAKIDNTLTSVRHALQYIGTDIFRKYDPDWHVNQLKKDINLSSNNKIVIDDVRFQNEFDVMSDMGAIMFFVIRPIIQNVSHHRSDEELNWRMFDKVIINDSTPDYAIKQMKNLIETGFNNAFDEEMIAYEELDLANRDVICEDETTIKIMKDNKLERKYHIYGNALVIEDLKRKLKYVKEEN